MLRGALSSRQLVWWAVLALPALAQTTSTSALELGAGNSFSNTYTIGAGDCSLRLRVRWKYNYSVGLLCTPLKLWSTEAECAETPGTNDVRYDDIPVITVSTAREGTFDVAISELPGFKEGTTTPCGTVGLAKTHKVCGAIEYSSTSCGFSGQGKLQASALKIVYDTLAPAAPGITEVVALDQSARVSFTVTSDAEVVIAEVKAPGAADFVASGEVLATAGAIKVSNLTNGNTYDIRLRAKDLAGNLGEPSGAEAVTPIKTIGFWGAYRYKGGTDQGGCTSAPGLLVPLALLWALRRRRR